MWTTVVQVLAAVFVAVSWIAVMFLVLLAADAYRPGEHRARSLEALVAAIRPGLRDRAPLDALLTHDIPWRRRLGIAVRIAQVARFDPLTDHETTRLKEMAREVRNNRQHPADPAFLDRGVAALLAVDGSSDRMKHLESARVALHACRQHLMAQRIGESGDDDVGLLVRSARAWLRSDANHLKWAAFKEVGFPLFDGLIKEARDTIGYYVVVGSALGGLVALVLAGVGVQVDI